MLPTPMLTPGSRKYSGLSCAWQSVMCSIDTLPKRGSAYMLSRPAALALP
jgi:hypothetical protein